MPVPTDLAKVFKTQLLAQFHLHTDKKPVQQLNPLRAAMPTFLRRAGEYRETMAAAIPRLERSPREVDRERCEVLKTVVAQLDAGLVVHAELCAQLDRLVAAYNTSSWGTQSYSPETKDATGKLYDRIAALRLAIGDNLTDDGALTKDVRDACAVGLAFSRNAPLDVKDAALRIVAAVEGPADKSDREGLEQARRRRAHLEANGVVVAAFLPPLKRSLAAQEAELGKGIAIKRGAAREQLDEQQFLLELANARLLSLVNAGMSQLGERAGIEARDELRDLLPKSHHGKPGPSGKKDVAPQTPGPVASGKAGAVAKPAEPRGSDPVATPSDAQEGARPVEKA